MRRFPVELVVALIVVVACANLYALLVLLHGVPSPGGGLGHGLGVIGFMCMLGAETLYSLRKRSSFTWGPTRTWLHVHVFLGIVGPALVLLHSGGKFHGLAGVVSLLTVIILVSGFVGRYIYTAMPRTLEGVEVGDQALLQRLAAAESELQALGVPFQGTALGNLATATVKPGWWLVLGRHWLFWRHKRQVSRAIAELCLKDPALAARLETMFLDRFRLRLQISSLAQTRRLLALWHMFHIPLGAVLFTLAFLHIAAALYYSSFLK